jgi:hypothetical protein
MVNIDTVYQKVLAFANKEQRGYITPQEFNLFADQAQMEIFEQYFYDKNQFGRLPGNDYAYSDMINNLDQKISIFEKYNKEVNVLYNSAAAATNPGNRAHYKRSYGDIIIGAEIPDIYRLGNIQVAYSKDNKIFSKKQSVQAERMSIKEQKVMAACPLLYSSEDRPMYIEYPVSDGNLRIKIYPYPHSNPDYDSVTVSYIRKPAKPIWGYVVVNDKPLWNSSTSTHFELHASEESELVYRILTYVGIAIEKPGLVQSAVGLEGAKQQQEKI